MPLILIIYFSQFNENMEVYLVKPDLTVKKTTAEELLPMSFNPKSLQEERIWPEISSRRKNLTPNLFKKKEFNVSLYLCFILLNVYKN